MRAFIATGGAEVEDYVVPCGPGGRATMTITPFAQLVFML